MLTARRVFVRTLLSGSPIVLSATVVGARRFRVTATSLHRNNRRAERRLSTGTQKVRGQKRWHHEGNQVLSSYEKTHQAQPTQAACFCRAADVVVELLREEVVATAPIA